MKHLLSIVTIHLNDFIGLKRTLRSLKPALDSDQVEWIFVDGGSNTGTSDEETLLNRAFQQADRHVSEPDKGIYDAMNKGSCMATAEYVLFLNAGDELDPEFDLQRTLNVPDGNKLAMIWGNCVEKYPSGSEVRIKTRSPRWAWYAMPVYHPAILFNREQMGVNPYNTKYKIAADYDLVCRLLKLKNPVWRAELPVSIFHLGGTSDIQSQQTRSEENQIRMQYFPVPTWLGGLIMAFKTTNRYVSKAAWFRRLWRGWI